ncbi:MAG: LTA synthase family protein, partial [Desulfobacterales bacterium]|nr:LTA synthase family protein [Desulfobacterales bacterium]
IPADSSAQSNAANPDAGEKPPDIYYIILDEFARLDSIEEVYGYEDDWFEKEMIRMGFYIAGKSETRFSSTWASLHSSLNLEYVDPKTPLKNHFGGILDNKTAAILKSKGYKYIYNSDQLMLGTYENPHAHMDFDDLKAGSGSLKKSGNPFNLMIIKTTMARLYYYKVVKNGMAHRANELLKLSILKQIPAIEGPKFVISHHLISHAPFVFDARGGMVDSRDHENWQKKNLYLDTYIYTTREIIKVLDAILRDSKNPPIIIVQSDHGPRGGQGANLNPRKLNLGKEWKKIFNAYYFPGKGTEGLYESISPVNSFRLILNLYFHENFQLLED